MKLYENTKERILLQLCYLVHINCYEGDIWKALSCRTSLRHCPRIQWESMNKTRRFSVYGELFGRDLKRVLIKYAAWEANSPSSVKRPQKEFPHMF